MSASNKLYTVGSSIAVIVVCLLAYRLTNMKINVHYNNCIHANPYIRRSLHSIYGHCNMDGAGVQSKTIAEKENRVDIS